MYPEGSTPDELWSRQQDILKKITEAGSLTEYIRATSETNSAFEQHGATACCIDEGLQGTFRFAGAGMFMNE